VKTLANNGQTVEVKKILKIIEDILNAPVKMFFFGSGRRRL